MLAANDKYTQNSSIHVGRTHSSSALSLSELEPLKYVLYLQAEISKVSKCDSLSVPLKTFLLLTNFKNEEIINSNHFINNP